MTMNRKKVVFALGMAVFMLHIASAQDVLLVPNGALPRAGALSSDNVQKFSLNTGTHLGVFASSTDEFGADNGKGILDDPSDVVIGPDSLVYVSFIETWSGGNNGGVARFNQDGSYHDLFLDFDPGGNAANHVTDPAGLAFDANGYLYVTDPGIDYAVRRYDSSGTLDVSYDFGERGNPAPRDIVRIGNNMVVNGKSNDSLYRHFDIDTGSTGTVTVDNGWIHGMTLTDEGDLFSISAPNDNDGDQDIALWDNPLSGVGSVTPSFAADDSTGSVAFGIFYHDSELLVHDGTEGKIRVFDATTGAEQTPLVDDTDLLAGSAWGMAVIPEPGTLSLVFGALAIALWRGTGLARARC